MILSFDFNEIFFENMIKFLLIIFLDLIRGPIILKIKEKIFRLRYKPIIFPIKKKKYIKRDSKKYFKFFIINNLVVV